jgi:hypothetical protein
VRSSCTSPMATVRTRVPLPLDQRNIGSVDTDHLLLDAGRGEFGGSFLLALCCLSGFIPGARSALFLAARSARSPGHPTSARASVRHAQTASMSPDVPGALVVEVSSSLAVKLTPHPGGKRPVPQVGQVPYARFSVTCCPPAACSLRARLRA